MADRPAALFALGAHYIPDLFPPRSLHRLQRLVRIDETVVAERFDHRAARAALASAEFLITGWGCPPITAAVLDAAPRLRAILHTAGSVKAHITPACWERGLADRLGRGRERRTRRRVHARGDPVRGQERLRPARRYRRRRHFTVAEVHPGVGNYGRTVGVIGASRIGRRVIELLRPFDLDVYLFDPYVDSATAAPRRTPGRAGHAAAHLRHRQRARPGHPADPRTRSAPNSSPSCATGDHSSTPHAASLVDTAR